MEYINLFQATDTLQNKGFRCVIHRHAGEIHFPGATSYLMIFMLQGDIEITPSMHTIQKIKAGNLIVIKPQTLLDAQCSDNTILLEYTPPKRLCNYLDQSSQAFQVPCSCIVPILPPLQKWIDSLLSTYIQSKEVSKERIHTQRKALVKILMMYPNNQLGELFIPFMFCAQHACDECLDSESATAMQTAVP